MNELILENLSVLPHKVYPHEEVIVKRKEKLLNYLKTSYEELIIPSILVCSESYVIIDGHHRYFALLELGVNKIPITTINYKNSKIITHSEKAKQVSKSEIIKAGLSGRKFKPKTSIHRISIDHNNHLPIILLSKLSLVNK